jgi:predicted enzyme related to lactoylglutathione lyase
MGRNLPTVFSPVHEDEVGCRFGACSFVTSITGRTGGPRMEGIMNHPVVHAEIRSSDPDATRAFFGDLFGWSYPNEGAFPGYTFVETGVPGALFTAISPLQGDTDLVTFFVGVDDMASVIAQTTRLGGTVVQEPVTVPGVSFALIADPLGHVVGLAQQL